MEYKHSEKRTEFSGEFRLNGCVDLGQRDRRVVLQQLCRGLRVLRREVLAVTAP